MPKLSRKKIYRAKVSLRKRFQTVIAGFLSVILLIAVQWPGR